MSRSWVGFLVGVAVWTATGLAKAEDAPRKFSLRWSAPDECADDARLVHQIEQLLGESLFEAKEQSLTVRATAQGNANQGYSARLSFSSPRGTEERMLEHPSCEQLVDAIALVIALAIDPERVRAAHSAVEASTTASAPGAAPSVVAPPVVPPAPVRPREPIAVAPAAREPERAQRPPLLHDFRVALHGVAGLGPLPGLAAGMQASLGWHRRGIRLELLGRYWLLSPAAALDNGPPAAKIDLRLATLGVRGCGLLASGAWQFAACGGADLGQESGEGSGLDRDRTSHALYAQLAGNAQLAYRRSGLIPEAGLELSGAVARPGFGVQQNGQLTDATFRPAALGLSLFFGLAFEP